MFFVCLKLSWSKSLVRKWFNIKCKTEEFQADEVVCEGIYLINMSFFYNLLSYLRSLSLSLFFGYVFVDLSLILLDFRCLLEIKLLIKKCDGFIFI